LVPNLSAAGLVALRRALLCNDPQLIQGRVSSPAPSDALRECAVDGACSIGYCGWHGDGLTSVGEIEEYFHHICDAADAAFNEPAACRYFLNWYDDAPRADMRRELLAEVNLALACLPLAA
jgi:hypothetical protein